jgi:hypothetical protein
MAGMLRRRRSDDEAHRNFALMTAYFGGLVPHADPKKLPPFDQWLAALTGKARKLSREEVMARLDAMAARGLITAH